MNISVLQIKYSSQIMIPIFKKNWLFVEIELNTLNNCNILDSFCKILMLYNIENGYKYFLYKMVKMLEESIRMRPDE